MDRLVFHEDETGIATLHDLSAFQFFDGYPSTSTELFATSGVWSPVRDDSGLAALGIAPSELDALVPSTFTRVSHVYDYYGSAENLSAVPAVAFALDTERALMADLSPNGTVTSIWILDHSQSPAWVRPLLFTLSQRWSLLLWDTRFDVQFPLGNTDQLDAWLAALQNPRRS